MCSQNVKDQEEVNSVKKEKEPRATKKLVLTLENADHSRISHFVEFFNPFLESGLVLGGRENDRARQSVFCTALNPFGQDTEDEPVVLFALFFTNNTMKQIGNAIKMRFCTKLSRAQNQGFRFW